MNPPGGPKAISAVPDLIRAQALQSPDAPAVESAGEQLTYRQLVSQAEDLAGHLLERGVRPGDLVAVAVPRGVDLVLALLGVHLAAAAYVPLDPEHPAERTNHILSDAQIRVLITGDAAGSSELRPEVRIHLDDVPTRTEAAPLPAVDPDTAAYAIYTSGSTGQPKGVLVSHRALANFMASMREQLDLPADVVLPAVTTVSFDIAGLELFLPLTTGGRVVLARQAEAADPNRLAALLARTNAQVMQATPVTWRLLLETGWTPPPGFTVLCGGERLPSELAERLLGEQTVLWDLYGPTETTIWSAVTRYERGVEPQFHAVRETSLHILDESLNQTPDGESGELYIGGTGLAIGYLGRPSLTAQRFVADPFTASGERLYRTGDLARRHPDGRIEILGRNDEQIKLRGYRIEPGEIEHALTADPSVAEAAVRAVSVGGETPRLIGYVRPADPANPPEAHRLRQHLARTLPPYMVPAQFFVLTEFPRTHNGKLDRAALPVSAPTAPTARPEPEATPEPTSGGVQQRVAEVLAQVLELPEIGPHDDFFALGGDSLRAVQAILTLDAELHREVPINALFEARTAYGLALLLEGEGAQEPELAALPADRTARLSPAQWWSWLHQQRVPDCTADNRPLAIRLTGPLDLPALEAAISALLSRHDVLRTRFDYDTSGQPAPIPSTPAPVRLAIEQGDPQAVLAAELAKPFDLSNEPPFRVRLVRDPAHDETHLLIVVHRIAADDRSLELIAKQIRAAYRGRQVSSPALQYTDYAAWQRDLVTSPAGKRHLDYWRTTLTGLNQAALRTDRPRPLSRDWQGSTVPFKVPAATTATLRRLASDNDTTTSTALLAAFFAVLDAHTDGTDLTIGIPVSARRRPELEDLVGVLEETAVIRANPAAAPEFGTLLTAVRDAVLAAQRHAALPIEEVVAGVLDVVETEPSPGRNPLFDVLFTAHGVQAEQPGFALPTSPGLKHDLRVRLVDRADGGIDGWIDYATQLFDDPTAARIADDFIRLLEAVCQNPQLQTALAAA